MPSVLEQLASGAVTIEGCMDSEPVTEGTMSAVLAAALEDTSSEEELDELSEQASSGIITLTPVEERSIVKLDKKAKKRQAYKVALYKAADEMKLKEFRQLKTLWKAENELDLIIERKAHTRAMQIMRETAKKHKDSPIDKIKRAVDSITRSQERTKKALSGTVKLNHNTQNAAKKITQKFS